HRRGSAAGGAYPTVAAERKGARGIAGRKGAQPVLPEIAAEFQRVIALDLDPGGEDLPGLRWQPVRAGSSIAEGLEGAGGEGGDRQCQVLRVGGQQRREAQAGGIESHAGNVVAFAQPGKVQTQVDDIGRIDSIDLIQRGAPVGAEDGRARRQVAEVVVLRLRVPRVANVEKHAALVAHVVVETAHLVGEVVGCIGGHCEVVQPVRLCRGDIWARYELQVVLRDGADVRRYLRN